MSCEMAGNSSFPPSPERGLIQTMDNQASEGVVWIWGRGWGGAVQCEKLFGIHGQGWVLGGAMYNSFHVF